MFKEALQKLRDVSTAKESSKDSKFKIGDLVYVANSGGKLAILLKPMKKGEIYWYDKHAGAGKLSANGWLIWWPHHHYEFTSMEEVWLTHV